MQVTLRDQVVKIIKQFFGRENIFGYETTLANQLFLLYCFCGKIYFTRKINNSFRFLYMLYNLSGLLVGYVIAGAFLLHDKEPDIPIQLFMMNVIANSTLMGFFIPFITFLHRDNIEKCIRDIDQILQKRSPNQEKLDLWKYVHRNIVIELLAGTVFGNICACDVLFFYDEEKVKNYTYYLFPFPNTEQTGTKKRFLINTVLSSVVLSSQALEALSAVAIILIWNVICISQLKRARENLDYRSAILSSTIEKNYHIYGLSRYAEKTFEKTAVRGIRDVQQITRLIENLRKFYQLFCSSAVPVTIIGVIVQLHSIVSTNLPWVVKIKGIGMMGAVAYPLLLVCWIGETLENSVSSVSFSVYSMPWYWSKNFRQNTYLFLCQTQHDLNFTSIKVYPMLLRTFSRFCHFVSSTVNFLHQLSR